MDAEKLNDALYEKMAAEQEQFRQGLLGQTAEEALNHAYEYTIREDILMAMEFLTLPEKQAAALLESPSPLADIFKDFRDLETGHMDHVRECVEDRAKNLLETKREATRSIPIYQQSGTYAMEHGELETFRASRQANVACKNAIEATIRDGFDGMYLNADAKDVLAEFGPERVAYVLAATVQAKDHDLRFSYNNRQWAQTVSVFEPMERRYEYLVDSHSAVLDVFINKARREMEQMKQPQQRKPSIKEQLAAKPVPGDQPTKPKDKEAR